MAPKYVAKAETASKEGGEEKADKGKAKGKGRTSMGRTSTGQSSEGGEGAKKQPVLTKARALAQIASLDDNDDEREATSKKISWILRKGAPRVGIVADDKGYIKMSDLLNAEILDEIPDRSEAKLMEVIDESNKQKLRYELKDGEDGGKLIRALKKEERKSKSGAEPGAQPGKAKESSDSTGVGLQVSTQQSDLRGDAPAFVPAAQAAAAASTLAHYSNPGAMANYPGFWNPYAGYGMYPAGYGYPGYPQAAAATDSKGNRRFQGRIKSFNTEKGYGFIESAEAYQIHGRDVFLHKAHIESFSVGTFISFTVQTNKGGMPQARDLVAADGSGQAQGKGKGKGKGKPKDGKDKKKKEGEDKKATEGESKDDKKGEGEAAEAPASADTDKPAEDKI